MKLLQSALFALLSLLSLQALAYSYAAAGKEPLIEGREKLFKAVLDQNQADIDAALQQLQPPLQYLEQEFKQPLQEPLQMAVKTRDMGQLQRVLDLAFKQELSRRLKAASEQLQDYQTAKVLVVKSRQYLDWLEPNLDEDSMIAADEAMEECLQALGAPGVFGAGAVPADAARFDAARNTLLQLLGAP